MKYKIMPDGRESKILSKVEYHVEEKEDYSIVDTFRPAYEALCDLGDIRPNPAVVWVSVLSGDLPAIITA